VIHAGITGRGGREAARSTQEIKEGISMVTGDGVAVAFGMEYCPINDIIKDE